MGMTATRLAVVPTVINERNYNMENNKMDAEIKFRCLLEEKGLLKKSADEVGLSMSDFIRSLIFGKEKLVLLSEGSEIARSLFMIHTDLDYFRNNGGIPKESVGAITGALNDVSTKLDAVSEKLTDIHAESEEVEADE